MIQIAYAIIWWFILLVIGLLTFPLVSRVCGRLQDKGYSISKILGLLLLTYFSWLLASIHLLKFGSIDISVSLLLLLALSFYLGRKNLNPKNLPWKSMIISETIFTVAFALFLVYLRYKPDIFYAYSEDFMDFAFLNSILRSDYFPPADPWLAGTSIPYYYGGHLVTAVLTLISKVPSSISYNLAVAMFFGLIASASYGIGYNITKRKIYGLVAVVFVCLAGFTTGVFQFFAFVFHHNLLGHSATAAHGFGDWLLHFRADGVIPYTGNAYPYYAFLDGDLHAQTMGIPFQLMYVTLMLSLLKRGDDDVKSSKSDLPLTIVILGISLGFFMFINTWEYPIYAAFTILAFIFFKLDLNKKGILGVILMSIVLYVPYSATRDWGGAHGLGIVHTRTDLADLVELFALFLFVAFSFFYISFRGRSFKGETLIIMTVLAIVIASVSFLCKFQLLLILIPLILVPLYCIYKVRERKESEFVLLFVIMGALIVLFCEVFFIRDMMPHPFERFDTILRFYLTAWIFLGIASAYGVFWVLRNTKGKLKGLWVAALLVLVLSCLIQPAGSTVGWASGKLGYFNISRGTLDGIAYVKVIAPGDYEAIKWINKNIKGQPVILEAPGGTYQFSSYVATMTGLPTVIGWVTHEVQFRGNWDKVAGRDLDVDNIYKSPDSDQSLVLLRKYNIEYIYVGKLEKERYPTEILLKFANYPERYTPVYENQGVVIYHVIL